MQSEAVFKDISERIISEITTAKNSIFIAVEKFTNRDILDVLSRKSKEGCQINILYTSNCIEENISINFDIIKTNNFRSFPIENKEINLFNNKFCVIDYCTVITGSYNWRDKEESNHGNITIINGATSLADQFICEFNKIKERYYPESKSLKSEFPLRKIIKRLEIIKNFVLLEEIDEVHRSASKLKLYNFNSGLNEILNLIQINEFGDVMSKIEEFINKNLQLSIWADPEISALKLEIKNIENQISAFDNEKIGIEKILVDFHHQHSIELGQIILEILRLRSIKFKHKKRKFEEAKRDEKEYKNHYEQSKEKYIQHLSEDQKKELRNKFRKATMMCHPDKFYNEPIDLQKKAEGVFKELNEANAKNDLDRVTEILENLENDDLKAERGDSISDKDILRETITRLKLKLNQLETEILNIKQSGTYQTVAFIEDWDLYFEQTKHRLKSELERLRAQIRKGDKS